MCLASLLTDEIWEESVTSVAKALRRACQLFQSEPGKALWRRVGIGGSQWLLTSATPHPLHTLQEFKMHAKRRELHRVRLLFAMEYSLSLTSADAPASGCRDEEGRNGRGC